MRESFLENEIKNNEQRKKLQYKRISDIITVVLEEVLE